MRFAFPSHRTLAFIFASFAASAAGKPVYQEIQYNWKNVHIGGGGFVTGIVFHPAERGLVYVRTDVGGAYRWDDHAQRWVQLVDFLGLADVNLTGIESLAIDPRDPERVYLAAGTYTHESVGNGAMLLSADRGRTFKRVDMPFKMGGNEAGRGNGERLAVDPHDGRILFFGSRTDGLWRSTDRGETWLRVTSFPALATAESSRDTGPRRQPVGIIWILISPLGGEEGRPSRTIYAAVSSPAGGLFRSRDGGGSWERLPRQPTGLRPTRAALAPDGRLFLAFGNDPGPNTMTDGAVWIFDPANGDRWTDITPMRSDKKPRTGFGYGCVTLDPADPDVVVATTFCRWEPHDEIFRSTNGGKTWTPLMANSRWDFARSPWAQHHEPHWIADFKIDPFNREHALFTTGYGLWAARDFTSASIAQRGVQWWFKNEGLEETVPLGLISPPEGAPLLSALGDLDGFKHDQLDQAPLQFAGPPRLANSESIAFAGQAPANIVRIGTIRRRTTEVRGAYSRDGGTTWTVFASEPPGDGGGRVTLTADGKTIVWTPWRSRAHRSADGGETWTACEGLPPEIPVVADRVDPSLLYAFDPHTGSVMVSTDGGLQFSPRATGLARGQKSPGGFGGGGAADVALHPSPDERGIVWLASRARGLSVSNDAGKTFRAIPNISAAYSLGFGKAAPGRDESALYLFGKIDGTTGLFRSNDTGATWMRINDDQHQFGWVNHVTGDPRAYGRVYFATGGRGIFYGEPAK
jgi:BNR/Asp-box repeat.